MSNQAGVHKDLLVEVVFETADVLKFAYLLETSSEGILCRQDVPGSPILYIRDTIKDNILYSRPIETPAETTGDAATPADTSPPQVVAVTGSAASSTDVAMIPQQPQPRPSSNLEFPCRVGQFYCGKCSEPLRELAHSKVRRTLQLARLSAVNDISNRSGMNEAFGTFGRGDTRRSDRRLVQPRPAFLGRRSKSRSQKSS